MFFFSNEMPLITNQFQKRAPKHTVLLLDHLGRRSRVFSLMELKIENNYQFFVLPADYEALYWLFLVGAFKVRRLLDSSTTFNWKKWQLQWDTMVSTLCIPVLGCLKRIVPSYYCWWRTRWLRHRLEPSPSEPSRNNIGH
jgi:hypothetical protein